MILLPQDTEALARRLADAQHVPIEDAIRCALEASERAAIDRMVRQIAEMPMLAKGMIVSAAAPLRST